MNILRITSTFVPPWSGLGPGPYELSIAQSKVLNNLIILTKENEGSKILDKKNKFKTIRINSNYDLLFSLKASLLALKIIREKNIDIVHNHGFSSVFLFFFKLIGLTNIPIVSSVHILRKSQFDYLKNVNEKKINKRSMICNFINLFKNLKYIIQEYLYIKYSNYLVTVSDQIDKDIRKYYGLNKNIIPVYNGVNAEKFSCEKKKKFYNDFIQIIFIGRLNQRKGEDDLLKAFLNLSKIHTNFKLKIIGNGSNFSNVEKFINVNGLHKKIELIKYMSNKEISKELCMSNIFVLPSYSEGLPKVLLEAMITKNIVVVSDIPPHKKLIKNYNNGFLFKVGDISQLTLIIDEIIRKYTSFQHISSNAKETIYKSYTWDKVAERILKVYEKILETK